MMAQGQRAHSRASSHMILADGLNWHVMQQGEGPVALLVHGTAASTHSWRGVMESLAGTHHAVAIDLPGHGRTQSRGSQDLSLPRMAKGIAAVFQAMRLELDTAAGHSAGAAILVHAATHGLLSPRSLVAFNGAFFPFDGVAGSLFSPIAKLMALNPFLPRIVAHVASPATVARLLRDTGSNLGETGVGEYLTLFKNPAHVAAALGMMAAWDLHAMPALLARLDVPAVFVAGDADRAVPPVTADRAAALCRSARALHIAAYGHLLHEENPALAAGIIAGRRT